MKNRISLVTLLLFVLVTSIPNFAYGEDRMNNVYEILTWKSKSGVSDKKMIEAVDEMVVDLRTLDGFLHQTLYKNKDGTWIDVYYWKTEKDAIASNDAMANKDSLKSLMELIEPDSVTIEIMAPLQSSGQLSFN